MGVRYGEDWEIFSKSSKVNTVLRLYSPVPPGVRPKVLRFSSLTSFSSRALSSRTALLASALLFALMGVFLFRKLSAAASAEDVLAIFSAIRKAVDWILLRTRILVALPTQRDS